MPKKNKKGGPEVKMVMLNTQEKKVWTDLPRRGKYLSCTGPFLLITN
jgi:hypothetical protein